LTSALKRRCDAWLICAPKPWRRSGPRTDAFAITTGELSFHGSIESRDTIVSATAAYKAVSDGQRALTDITETHAMAWTDAPDPDLWEQTRVGKDGYTVTLLLAERPDEDEGETGGTDEPGIPRFR